MNQVALDGQLQLVADSQRRELLFTLLDSSPVVDVACDGGVSMRDDESQRRVAMQHTHIPKLADADVVTWDRDTGRVSRGPEFDDIRPLLTLLSEHENELSDHVAVQ